MRPIRGEPTAVTAIGSLCALVVMSRAEEGLGFTDNSELTLSPLMTPGGLRDTHRDTQ